MTKLAEALEVTGRRVTALVDALADDGLVERYAHPTDGRSTIVEITEAGRERPGQVWEQHHRKSPSPSEISPMRTRCTGRTSATSSPCLSGTAWQNCTRLLRPYCRHPYAVLIRNNRRVRAARPQSS